MTTSIETSGTGTIEHSGTGNIEHSGTGSIEHTGTGSIEHSGTGSIERAGSGRVTRALLLSATMACVFSGAALADTASYNTSHGTIDIHSNGSDVRISWHYDDGVTRQFLVGAGSVSADYSMLRLTPVESLKIQQDGSGNSSSYGPAGAARATDGRRFDEMGAPVNLQKIQTDGTGNASGSSYEPTGPQRAADSRQFNEMGAPANLRKIQVDGTGNGAGSAIDMELIFTPEGVEAVATLRNAHAKQESIVLDMNNSGDFAEAMVFIGTESF